MRRHSEIGARILANARLGDIGQWVLAHHERVDGSGFPSSAPPCPATDRVTIVVHQGKGRTGRSRWTSVQGRPARRGNGIGVLVLFVVVVVAAVVAASRSPAPFSKASAENKALASYGKVPLLFVPNEGQADRRVRYYAQGGGHAFYFTRNKAVLSFTKGRRGVALHMTPFGANRIDTSGSRRRAAGEVTDAAGWWCINLPTYKALTYRNRWPGVDMVYSGRGGALKYELRVRPGADRRGSGSPLPPPPPPLLRCGCTRAFAEPLRRPSDRHEHRHAA